MRKIVNLLVIVAVVCLFSTLTVFGKGKSEYIRLTQDVVVGGTLVKKGEYKLKFNEESGELVLMDGSEVVAKTTARLEKAGKAVRTQYITVNNELSSVVFRGQREQLIVTQGTAKGAASTQPTTAQ